MHKGCLALSILFNIDKFLLSGIPQHKCSCVCLYLQCFDVLAHLFVSKATQRRKYNKPTP